MSDRTIDDVVNAAKKLGALKQTHTPTPWSQEGLSIFVAGKVIIATCPTPQKTGVFDCSANAEFIVRAVNSHDALLSALKQIIEVRGERDKVFAIASMALLQNGDE
jgi:hypothetical protein